MKESDDDAQLQQTLRTALQSSESPDAVVRARLSAARARAVDGQRRSSAWPWAVAGAASVAAIAMWGGITLRPHVDMQGAAHPDDLAQDELFELLTDDNDPLQEAELYEDLDVLTWLSEEEDRA